MKLERLPEYVTVVVTVIVGMTLALYVGSSTGSGSNMPWIIVGAIIAMSIALIMRERIWVLIPLCWPLMGKIVGLPGSLPARDAVILYVFPVFLALKALKVVRTKLHYTWIDYLLLANLFYLFTVYLRNPVGTESLGFERVGGRAYFETVFAYMGYWVIGHVTLPVRQVRRFPLILIGGSLFAGGLSFITYHFPSTYPVISKIYSGVSAEGFLGETMDADQLEPGQTEGREGYLANLGGPLLKALHSVYPPFSTLNPLYIWRFLGMVIGVASILKSGFRSSLVGVVLFFIFASWLREGPSKVIRRSLLLIPVIALMLTMQGTVVSLPPAVQRALSFLPGKWDTGVAEEAQGSSNWRREIWARIWSSDHKYISNWWLGDGFGLTQEQLNEVRQMESFGSNEDRGDNVLITGNYHSLPLTAIHTVGFLGFGLFLLFFVGAGVYGWQLIQRSKGTPYFALAMFAGIPTILAPIPSIFLTGFYDVMFIETIFIVALLRLFSRSLDQHLLEMAPSAVAVDGDALPELVSSPFGQSDLSGTLSRRRERA